MARKLSGRPSVPQPQAQTSDQPPPSVASEEVEELPADIFSKTVDITKSKDCLNINKTYCNYVN